MISVGVVRQAYEGDEAGAPRSGPVFLRPLQDGYH